MKIKKKLLTIKKYYINITSVLIRHKRIKAGEKMNSKLLRSVMYIFGDTNKTLAKALGITENSLSNKINEKGTEFKQSEIVFIKNRYELDMEQVEDIFFNAKCLN